MTLRRRRAGAIRGTRATTAAGLVAAAATAAAVLTGTLLAPAPAASAPGGAGSAATPLAAARTVADPPRWRPRPGLLWQVQLSGTYDPKVPADVVQVDGADTPPATVAAIRKAGRKAVCYVSAGSWEDWREDAGRYPAAVLGKGLDGWPGERWLDIRRLDVLLPILRDRITLCAARGYDGIDLDNVDGWINDTGFPLRAADQLRFNRALAAEAHRRGLAVGLKNDLRQIPQLVGDFDWATNEQCFQYDECELLLPFVQAGKPVVVIEYDTPVARFCPEARRLGFDAMRKRLALGAWRDACPRARVR